MSHHSFTFSRFHFFTDIPLVIVFLVSIFLSVLFGINGEYLLFILPIPVYVFVIWKIYKGFLSKIYLTETSIHFVAYANNVSIEIEDIKSYGVFTQFNDIAVESDFDNPNLSRKIPSYIFVSTNCNPDIENKVSDTFICFMYREEAHKILQKILKNHEGNFYERITNR